MNEERTVIERLERIHRIANDHKIAHLDEDNQPIDPHRVIEELDEIRGGIGNVTRDIKESLEADLRDCVHCGSPFTFRRSDGDIGCKDCRSIMPHDEVRE